MKIEDGFDNQASRRAVRETSTKKIYNFGTMMAFGAIVLLAAALGFLGGMQVNKTNAQAAQNGFNGMSRTATNGVMPTPPTGTAAAGQAANTTSSSNSTAPAATTSNTSTTTTN